MVYCLSVYGLLFRQGLIGGTRGYTSLLRIRSYECYAKVIGPIRTGHTALHPLHLQTASYLDIRRIVVATIVPYRCIRLYFDCFFSWIYERLCLNCPLSASDDAAMFSSHLLRLVSSKYLRVSIVCLCLFTTTSAITILPSVLTESAIAVQNSSDIVDFQILKTPFPYEFPNAKDAANLFPMPLCNGIALEEASIDSLQDAMRSGILTSSQIASCYLQRIYQTDSYIEYVDFQPSIGKDCIMKLT